MMTRLSVKNSNNPMKMIKSVEETREHCGESFSAEGLRFRWIQWKNLDDVRGCASSAPLLDDIIVADMLCAPG